MSRRRRHPLTVFIALLLVALPAAAEVAKPYGGETPQALVERLKAAAAAEDMAGVAACMAPDDRAALALTMTAVTGMVIAFAGMGSDMAGGMAEAMGDEEMSEEDKKEMEEQKAAAAAETEKLEQRFQEIMERYGIDDPMAEGGSEAMEDSEPSEMLAGVDQVGLIADLMALLESLPGDGEDGGTEPMDIPEGELQGLEIDGDRATARLGDDDVEFVRVDGRWYVSLDFEENGESPEEAPAEDDGAAPEND